MSIMELVKSINPGSLNASIEGTVAGNLLTYNCGIPFKRLTRMSSHFYALYDRKRSNGGIADLIVPTAACDFK